mgnify:FL=1
MADTVRQINFKDYRLKIFLNMKIANFCIKFKCIQKVLIKYFEKLFVEKRKFKNENNSFFTSLQQKF